MANNFVKDVQWTKVTNSQVLLKMLTYYDTQIFKWVQFCLLNMLIVLSSFSTEITLKHILNLQKLTSTWIVPQHIHPQYSLLLSLENLQDI